MNMEEKEIGAVRKFRLIAGSHVQNKKTYTKGKIVKSTFDLCHSFPGKFVEIGKPDDGSEEETSVAAKTATLKPKTAAPRT